MAGSPKYKPVASRDSPPPRKTPPAASNGFKLKPVWIGFIVAGCLCLTGLLFTFGNYRTPVRRRGIAGPQFNHDKITLQAHYSYIDSTSCSSKGCKSSASPKSFSKFAAKPNLVNAKSLTNQTALLKKVLLSGISINEIRSVYRQMLTMKTNGAPETSFKLEQRRLRPVKAFVQSCLSLFGPASFLKCSYDPLMGLTLSHDRGSKGCMKYVLAAHFKNQAAILPNFVVQLLRTILALPPGSTYVSILGASELDRTSLYLDVLKLLLVPIETSARIESSSATVLASTADPVQATADIRNAVISPFFEKKAKPDGIVGDSPYCFNPDYVVYMSEAAFCPHDLVRLMLHRVDISCGLAISTSDFDLYGGRRLLQQSSLPATQSSAKRKLQQGYMDDEYMGDDYEFFETYGMYDEEMDYEIFERTTAFTNAEVATVRDITGGVLMKDPPYFSHKESAGRATSGKPVQVYCCWSGIVVLNSAPFKSGVRFRVSKDGECRSSEKSLLCDDFHRVNHDVVLLDTSVRITNSVEGYRSQHLTFEAKTGFREWPWQNAVGAEPAPLPHNAEDHTHVQCCEREPNTDKYSSTCKPLDIMATNYTKIAFP